jgi:hypothetical protein
MVPTPPARPRPGNSHAAETSTFALGSDFRRAGLFGRAHLRDMVGREVWLGVASRLTLKIFLVCKSNGLFRISH